MSEFASIFLTGEILPGFLKEDVISALARLLKTDKRKAAALLNGQGTLIKRNVALSDVERYLQALHKAGAAARSMQVKTPPTTIFAVEHASAPPPASITAVSKQAPKMPQELALAPGWTKPGEEAEHTSLPIATAAHTTSTRFSRSASASRTSRSRSTRVTGNDDGHEPVYADVSFFGLSTQGRIGRLRYMAYNWPAIGLILAAGIVAALLISTIGFGNPGGGMIALVVLLAILILWMSIRVTALRLHDMNKSGKWIFLPILIIAAAAASRSPRLIMAASAVYWIMYIGLMLWPGSKDDNDYGPPPAPNTDWVYIGAALFLGSSALSLMQATQYDKYATRFSAKTSKGMQGRPSDAFMRIYAEHMDKRTPLMMNSMMRLDKVEYVNKVLRYKATVQGNRLVISEEQKEELKTSLLQSYCGQAEGFFPSNKVPVDFVFRYQDTAWDYDSFTLRLSPKSCS